MEHKLINNGQYLLVVSDDEIKDSCFVYKKTGEAHYEQGLFKIPGDIDFDQFNKEKTYTYKVLAHLPLNNSPILQGVDLLPPLKQEDDEGLRYVLSLPNLDYLSFTLQKMLEEAYNKAKEKYKYTEEDMREAYEFGLMNEHKSVETNDDNFRYYQSLSQPKLPVAFKCEMERVHCTCICHRDNNVMHFVACCNDGWIKTDAQLKINNVWVGEYIYQKQTTMKLVTDNAFSKAWKNDCPTCMNSKLWFKKSCHECSRTYSRKELGIAIYESYVAAKSTTESVAGVARIVIAKLNSKDDNTSK